MISVPKRIEFWNANFVLVLERAKQRHTRVLFSSGKDSEETGQMIRIMKLLTDFKPILDNVSMDSLNGAGLLQLQHQVLEVDQVLPILDAADERDLL